jgi:hypothetical protein
MSHQILQNYRPEIGEVQRRSEKGPLAYVTSPDTQSKSHSLGPSLPDLIYWFLSMAGAPIPDLILASLIRESAVNDEA